MDADDWVEAEDPEEYGEEPWDFDEAERAFLTALRARAARWRVPWAPSQAGRPEDGGSLLVHVALVDEARGLILGEWAAHFHGAHVRAGKVLDHLFSLHEPPDPASFEAEGPPEALAERCADWFEALLSRPVVRVTWPLTGGGGGQATRWEFADTGEPLASQGSVPAAVPGHRVRLRP
ncbi:hypothetical protein [Streptomyces sp. NPDC048659]|uniref:hypothetical protein n=1 Tax=Streptomyces sp. NPDC048659 TaxID=3155489 RepID=UPI0034483191